MPDTASSENRAEAHNSLISSRRPQPTRPGNPRPLPPDRSTAWLRLPIGSVWWPAFVPVSRGHQSVRIRRMLRIPLPAPRLRRTPCPLSTSCRPCSFDVERLRPILILSRMPAPPAHRLPRKWTPIRVPQNRTWPVPAVSGTFAPATGRAILKRSAD